MGIFTALLILSFLVFFHELGHFLAAKFFNTKIEVFSIGFGKKIFGFQKNGVQYMFAAIPLGGYVKFNERENAQTCQNQHFSNQNSENSSVYYEDLSAWRKIVILFFGPAFNMLLAFILYFGIFINGVPVFSSIIGSVGENAANAGLQAGDRILSIDSENVRYWDDISPIVQKSQGQIVIKVERQNSDSENVQILDIAITPQLHDFKNMFGEDGKRKVIGISPSVKEHRDFGIFGALKEACKNTIDISLLILQSFEKLAIGAIGVENLSSVIGITEVLADSVNTQHWALNLAQTTALISLSLCILNILPLPLLDGGNIVVCLYEGIFRRKISPNASKIISVLGILIIFGLMSLGIFNDLVRIFGR